MRRLCLLTLLVLTATSQLHLVITRADEAGEKAAAEKATGAWLALVDSGKYAESWDQAAGAVQEASNQRAMGKSDRCGSISPWQTGFQEVDQRSIQQDSPWGSRRRVCRHSVSERFRKQEVCHRNAGSHEGQGWTMAGIWILHQVRD